MLIRQRIILDFLLRAPQLPSKMLLLKWLFLARQESKLGRMMSFYDFVPCHYGPFSFCVCRELRDLASAGFLHESGSSISLDNEDGAAACAGELTRAARNCVTDILAQYGSMSAKRLLRHIYAGYPWYASRSRLADHEGTGEVGAIAIHTIGYEGRSVDAFLDMLLQSRIDRLIDVRRNAFSRKYGFSRRTLAWLCEKVGIEYVHVPELGVPSSMRSNLDGCAAYEELFDYYEAEILPRESEAVERVSGLITEKPSTLMCFEVDHEMCHRGRLAAAIEARTGLECQHL